MYLSCRTAVDSVLMKLLKLCKRDTRLSSYEGCRLRSISVVWFFLSLSLSLVTTKITYIIDFTGGLAAVFIFFFPGTVIALSCSMIQRSPREWFKAWWEGMVLVLSVFTSKFGCLSFHTSKKSLYWRLARPTCLKVCWGEHYYFCLGWAYPCYLFSVGIVLLKLSLDSTTFSNLVKYLCVSFSCLLIVLGTFVFGLSFAGTIMIDAHLYN